jgi:hypothetical protein
MGWVREKVRVGAWVALFALAVQITLSFGHIHVAPLAPNAATSPKWQAPDHGPPFNGDRPSDAQDYCAICATIGLVAGTALPEPSRLTLPVANFYAWPRELAATPPSRQAHNHFRARAPPFLA